MNIPYSLIVILFLDSCYGAITAPSWNKTQLDKLRNDLLTNYDKYAKPDQHDDVMDVGIGITVLHVDLDELNSTLVMLLWIKLNWNDPKLRWDKEHYEGIDVIRMADHEIWQPDIYLFNSASTGGEAVARYGNPNALVFSNGDVLWIPPIKFTALCQFDFYYWPFDTQKCYLKFGSWTRSGKEIKLRLYGKRPIEFEPPVVRSGWKVNYIASIATENGKFNSDEFYIAFFNLTLIRGSSPYIVVVVSPIIITTLLTLMQCWLPFESGERIIFCCSTAVMICMFLIYFTQRIVATGLTAPWIVSFYGTCLYFTSFNAIEAVCMLLLLKPKYKQTLPWNVQKVLQGRFGKLLLLKDYALPQKPNLNCQLSEETSSIDETHEDTNFDKKYTQEDMIDHEWKIFTLAVDRVLFVIYVCVFLILFLAFLM